MTLTDKQLRKIFAAQEAGVSKREVFEIDVFQRRIDSLSKKDQDRLISDMQAKRPIPQEFVVSKKQMTANKALAIIDLKRDRKAKEAFLKQDTLRLQSFRAEQLR